MTTTFGCFSSHISFLYPIGNVETEKRKKAKRLKNRKEVKNCREIWKIQIIQNVAKALDTVYLHASRRFIFGLF